MAQKTLLKETRKIRFEGDRQRSVPPQKSVIKKLVSKFLKIFRK